MGDVFHGGRRAGGLAIALIAASAVIGSSASAGETRGYAVSWFHAAGYVDKQNRDCPQGLNPPASTFYARELKRLGLPPKEIEQYLNEQMTPKFMDLVRNRGRIDGKPVNVYANPESV